MNAKLTKIPDQLRIEKVKKLINNFIFPLSTPFSYY